MNITPNRLDLHQQQEVDVGETVRAYLLENYLFSEPGQKISADQSLVGSGIIDSAAILSLILFLEDEFGITVHDDEVIPENIDSLNTIASYVYHKQTDDRHTV
ncbi:MAG TPA: acyl carrier protein [Gammaproteobacteria bacterium]|nr:acyl carrier protein [Gammaproteobacteria bacterium]